MADIVVSALQAADISNYSATLFICSQVAKMCYAFQHHFLGTFYQSVAFVAYPEHSLNISSTRTFLHNKRLNTYFPGNEWEEAVVVLGKLSLFVNLNLFRLYKISQTMWLLTPMLFCSYFCCYLREKAYKTWETPRSIASVFFLCSLQFCAMKNPISGV